MLSFPDVEQPFIVGGTNKAAVAVLSVLSQKKEDEKVHQIFFTSRAMTATARRYFARERKTLAMVFRLQNFRLCLLFKDSFVPFTDQSALLEGFSKKDIHGRFTGSLDSFAEYDFEFPYCKLSSDKTADFL